MIIEEICDCRLCSIMMTRGIVEDEIGKKNFRSWKEQFFSAHKHTQWRINVQQKLQNEIYCDEEEDK